MMQTINLMIYEKHDKFIVQNIITKILSFMHSI